jgi:two-component system, cell cycle sensor histidine kinase and response regulator CckA
LVESFRNEVAWTGYTDDIVVRHGILQTEVPFLQKPFSIDALAKKIRNLFDQK